ncbi:D-isomer-specific 2-hydroxyacid dehydrogenase-like protein [Amylocarpus encephaloides]|uniref:D-isomer-specific 2-hydroxyacid dehydrogenase-like protein n=1 Tax=Amylocarpus encephaloides TaxID=45428 RepID=A0A9P8C2N7_9HELO|nr:D-isomer-specific 2-hydroxyacid dehydrogenase-like protein [Amylocarpus encephaloides]
MGGGANYPDPSIMIAKEHILCLLPVPANQEILDRIVKAHPNVDFTYRQFDFTKRPVVIPDEDELYKKATILVTIGRVPNPEVAGKIKLIHVFSAGVDWLEKTPIWRDTKIPITNSSGIHAPQIAEWVILQILSLTHHQKTMLSWQSQHIWGSGRQLSPIKDSVGKRLGVLGYGAIGRQVAHLASALGMDVIAYTASPRPTPESKKDRGYIVPSTGDPDGTIPSSWFSGTSKSALHTFLSQSLTHLLISVPLTPSTHHMLSTPEFSILSASKPIIINIARGAIIDQPALIEALKSGEVGGAALDVTEPEPLPRESELWEMENVVVSPHVSGNGTAYWERSMDILEKNLTRIEEGGALLNLVDRGKGY